MATVAVKTSRIAVVAAGLALLNLVLFLPGLVAVLDPRLLNPEGNAIRAISSSAMLLTFPIF